MLFPLKLEVQVGVILPGFAYKPFEKSDIERKINYRPHFTGEIMKLREVK